MNNETSQMDEREEQHKAMGIGFENGKYTYGGHKYGNLKYAVDYAKKNPSVNLEEQIEQITQREQKDRQLEKIASVILSTAPSLSISKPYIEIEIVTAECVFGVNIFRDLFQFARDAFGGRSKASQKVLRDARKSCLNELKQEAYSVGADAVIAVDLDYSEISGQSKSMLFLVASGTAIRFLEEDERALDERS